MTDEKRVAEIQEEWDRLFVTPAKEVSREELFAIANMAGELLRMNGSEERRDELYKALCALSEAERKIEYMAKEQRTAYVAELRVIETRVLRGNGVNDPVRLVRQFWLPIPGKDYSELLAESDPVRP